MAEQRTNLDIEDVLSSIRRLVSEEPPRSRRPEVLVLTPALRVVEGSAPPREPRSPKADAVDYDSWPVGLPLQSGLQTSPVRLTDFALPQAEPASARRPSADPRTKPTELSEQAPPQPSASRFERADAAQSADLAPSDPPQDFDLEMPAEEDIAAFFLSHSADGRSLEDRIAGLQAAIAQTSSAQPGSAPTTSAPIGTAHSHTVSSAYPSTSAAFEPDGSERPETFGSASRAADSPSADVVRSRQHDRRSFAADPVEPQARFTAPRPHVHIEDAVELAPEPLEDDAIAPQSLYAQPNSSAKAAAPEADYEEALIDEDSLRDIVAELVRQELRGELGERITRNVRSLIRRELNRALALRDLRDD